jgi:uncharacterized protein (DUF3820 family)
MELLNIFGGDKEKQAIYFKELVNYRMPFGKYKGSLIRELPVSYLEWFSSKGFPEGKLGDYLQTMFVIKTNGLESLLHSLSKKN